MSDTKIKICGLYRVIDVDYANETMPDYIGFIFYPKSHRYVSEETAKFFQAKLNPDILSVGVFVNEPTKNILRIAKLVSFDIIQLHGDEDNDVIDEIRSQNKDIKEIWKAIRIKDKLDLSQVENCSHADRFVMDAFVEGYGGEGKSFDWSLIKDVDREKIIIAGGVNADNIDEIINNIAPYSVDLSSGVETDKVKDLAKMKEIIGAVRKS